MFNVIVILFGFGFNLSYLDWCIKMSSRIKRKTPIGVDVILLYYLFNICVCLTSMRLFMYGVSQVLGHVRLPPTPCQPVSAFVGTDSCVCICVCVSSVFRIVNGTSTEASLAPGIDQLYSTNSWQGVNKVHKVV